MLRRDATPVERALAANGNRRVDLAASQAPNDRAALQAIAATTRDYRVRDIAREGLRRDG